jgi:NADP-dependent 3-hydroxy acid dehydrogenase YdfG
MQPVEEENGMQTLNDKCVLVTGVSSGFGIQFAKLLV